VTRSVPTFRRRERRRAASAVMWTCGVGVVYAADIIVFLLHATGVLGDVGHAVLATADLLLAVGTVYLAVIGVIGGVRLGISSLRSLHGDRTLRRDATEAPLDQVAGLEEAGFAWRLIRLCALLMPPAAGRRWLEEAQSFLAEAQPSWRRRAPGSYIASAPQLIFMSWTRVITGGRSRASR